MLRLKQSLYALIAALALSASACGDDLEKAINKWTDASCACKDESCAKKQRDAFQDMEKKFKEDAKDKTKGELDELQKVYKKGDACLDKLVAPAG